MVNWRWYPAAFKLRGPGFQRLACIREHWKAQRTLTLTLASHMTKYRRLQHSVLEHWVWEV